MKDTKKITINGEKVEIKKIAIGKFAEMLMAIEHLPIKFQNIFTKEEMKNFSNEVIITKIPLLLREATEEFFALVAIACEIKREKIKELSIEDFIDLVTAVIEINNFSAIVKKVKNLAGILQKKYQ